MNSGIADIASDNTSGAAEILRRAAAVFSQLRIQNIDNPNQSLHQAQSSIIQTGIALSRAQRDMISLLRLASSSISAARTATSAGEAFRHAEEEACRFITAAEQAGLAAAAHAAKLIHNHAKVLTHSRSSTVLLSLSTAKQSRKKFSVIATESRPLMEGRTLARELAARDIPVTLIADAAAALAMPGVDLVLVGADSVTSTHLLNKIGTRMIALAAKEHDIPMYAVCDSTKFAGSVLSPASLESRDGKELWQDAPEGVSVDNQYFEPILLSSFNGVIVEDGILSSTDAAFRAEQVSVDESLWRD